MIKLTEKQKQIVDIESIFENTSINTLGVVADFTSRYSYKEINEGLNNVIKDLDAFQIRYFEKDTILHQKFDGFQYEDIPRVELSSWNEYEEFKTKQMRKCYFNKGAKLYDIYILHKPNGKMAFGIFMHHSISDAWSLAEVFSRKLCQYMLNTEVADDSDGSFEEYIKKNLEERISKRRRKNKEYWNKSLENYEGINQYPKVSSMEELESKRLSFTLDKEETESIIKGSQNIGISLPVLFLSSLVLLKSYEKQSEAISVGAALLGRKRRERKIFGEFVHLLPLLVNINKDMSVKEFLLDIQNKQTNLFKHSEYSYSEISDYTNRKLKKELNLLEIGYSFQNANYDSELTSVIDNIEWLKSSHQHIPLTVHVSDRSNEKNLNLDYDYRISLFDEKNIERMHIGLIYIVKQLIDAYSKSISIFDLNILPPMERHKILLEFNKVPDNTSKNETTISVFEKQVCKFPNKTAVAFEDKEMSYEELNKKSNELAHKLLEVGVKKEEPIVILAERSLELIVGILGVLKAGACYVPIDHTYPKERIDFIVEDVGAKIALLGDFYYDFKKDLTRINLKDDKSYKTDSTNPNISLAGNNLAYVMYTSGTSGKPKGSLIEHKSIIRLVKDTNYISFDEEIRILQTGSIAFDASTFEFFGSLLNGGTLYLETQDTLTDVDKLSKSIKENNINTIVMTTSLFNQMLDIKSDMFKNLDNLLVGGEKQSTSHIRKFKSLYPEIKFSNGYGPTENTTFTTAYEIPNDFDKIPIGKPITGTQVYIMNGDKLCGIGIPGELCITGSGVSRGYLNREELTKEKFVDNPFGEGKMYKSGDLARWLPDGNIEFLGRIDQQVKIRGYRIELQEVVEVFNKQAGVKESVVIAKEVEEGDKTLLAYVVMEDKKELELATLKEGARKELPEYMMPSHIMAIDEIPLTVNGKTDKVALPEIQFERQDEYIAPTEELEKIIAATFEEVLGVESVGLHDSFFELGGDSIKAIQVSSIIRELGYRLTIKDIMKYQTAGNIYNANVIEKDFEEYSQDPISGEVTLSPIQSRFLLLDLENPNHFNQSVVLEISSPLKADILKSALNEVVKHHDMLRVIYDPDQRIKSIDESEALLVFSEVFVEEDTNEEIEKAIQYEQSTMDIQNGPLLHAILFHTKTKNYLMITIHHLAVDAVSWRILVVDIFTTYNQMDANKKVELPKKTASYSEWVESLKEFGKSHYIHHDKKHWDEIAYESKFIDRLFFKPKTQKDITKKRLGVSSFEVSKEKCAQMIMQYQKIFGIETDEFFITALNIALNKWKNVSSYILELETHGREELHKNMNINRTVGWFTNIFPLILKPSANINDAILEVKRSFLKVPNQGMSYGILNYLDNDDSMNVEGDIVFNFIGDTSLENHELKGIKFSNRFNQFDLDDQNKLFHPLTINGAYIKDKVVFTNYYDHLFISKEDMESFEKYFLNAIEDLYDYANSDYMPKERINVIEEVSTVEFLDEEMELLNQLMEGIGAND